MKSKFWLAGPEAHDFPAAADYLDLLFPEQATTVFAPSTTCLKTLKYLPPRKQTLTRTDFASLK